MDVPEVKPEQVWVDNDPRCNKRKIKIERVENGFAHCVNVETGRSSRISLQRFKPSRTGYTLAVEGES